MKSNGGFLGCNSKLPAFRLNALVGGPVGMAGDFSCLRSIGDLALSIDTVALFSEDAGLNARIAISHCSNDLYCAGLGPSWGAVAFGFPRDWSDEKVGELSEHVGLEMSRLGIHNLNSHSSLFKEGFMTFTLLGEMRGTLAPAKGDMDVFLTKPLGGMYEYLASGNSDFFSRSNKEYVDIIKSFATSATTDISGFGLINHLYYSAAKHGLYITLDSESLSSCCSRELMDVNDFVCSAQSNFLSEAYRLIEGVDFPVELVSAGETNGPIAIFIPKQRSDEFLSQAIRSDLWMVKIGGASAGVSNHGIRIFS